MRIRVVVSFVTQHNSCVFQLFNDEWIGLKHLHSDKVGDLAGEPATRIHRQHEFDACISTNSLVIFAETWRDVHYTRAVLRGDEIASQHAKRPQTRAIGKIRQQRLVGSPHQVAATHGVDMFGPSQLTLIRLASLDSHDVARAVQFINAVVHIRGNR